MSTAGTRLIYCNVHHAFHRLVGLAGLTPRSGSCRPRIHDLRHSFAVAAMLDAYAAGQDGQTRLTLLSTWLGHVHPAEAEEDVEHHDQDDGRQASSPAGT